ncbi:hypothetical protein QS257_18135 [Terrilactibacillus sp. S3-3]|nr:hypothetical protein QS257_18135 [Terrilactibacillus sp. S3-3]
MGQPGQRTQKNSLIIESDRISLATCIAVVFTAFFWGYSLLVLLFFLSALIGFHNEFLDLLKNKLDMPNSQLRHFLYFGAAIWLLFFLLCSGAGAFTIKKRFGPLTRRKYPRRASDEDMLALQLVSRENYMKLKKKCESHYFRKKPDPGDEKEAER